MQKHHPTLSSFHFKRAKTDGIIEVLNEGLYVMAEYNERSGVVKWQRVVLASQREQIENWLAEHYPRGLTAIGLREIDETLLEAAA